MNNLQIIEHKKQRVLTTQQLAESYGTDTQVIVNNFNRNKERYTEGKHFYALEGEEKRQFINLNQIDVGLNAQHFYLWTEKGAWLHAKSLNTDEAWGAYEILVDEYYRIKDAIAPLQDLSPQLQLLINLELKQKELESSVMETKAEVQGIRDVVALNPHSWREDTKNLIVKMARQLGGNEHIRDIRTESYQLLDVRFGVNLQQRLTNKRRRMADEGVCVSKRNKLNPLDVIADDKKLIEGYVAIVKEMAIKYGAVI